jgi:hypothetical protein
MNTLQGHELAEKIVDLLNQGTQQLDPKTTDKLLAVRKKALAHFQEKPAHVWAPEWVTTLTGRIGLFAEPFSHNLRASVALLALLTSIALVFAWQTLGQQGQGSEIAEIDEGLLTDELPINAYLDKGFDSWLKRPSR